MSAMTDEQVRAELERIDPRYVNVWDALIMCQRGLPPDRLQEMDVLRLLAESQQALGEIVGLLQHQLDNEEPDDLVTILQLLDALMIIARKQWKGGK